jgi:hypothetical protein
MRILAGRDQLRPSNNAWDWLGGGIYFFESNPDRALSYAKACADKKQKFNGEIRNPFVIGAKIELGNCLNLIAPPALRLLKEEGAILLAALYAKGTKIPENKGPNRSLDCAVINWLHESNKKNGLAPYDTIRSPFHEGEPIYHQANFTEGLHIEICVRNPGQIMEYFLPEPVGESNPWLYRDYVSPG